MTQARVGNHPGVARPVRRNRAGCVVSVLMLIVILVLVIGAGFVFIVRPYAQSQLDQAMTQAVDQIPDAAVLLPPGPISVNNNFLTNLIVTNLAPSDPVKNPQATITPQGVHINLEIFGQPCSIQGLPQLINGQIKATNVQVGGPLALFISPDEATTMINRHLADAQARLKHPIQKLTLQNNNMTITLGSPLSA